MTETQLDTMLRNDDPAAMRYFGALLETSTYTPLRRTQEQNDADAAIKASWPKFSIVETSDAADVTRAFLWEPVKENRGSNWLPYYQQTGSCVGNGGGQATNYLMAVEAWEKGEPEEVKFPLFYLYPYGRSRVYANLRGPGEGSFGSAFARAIKDDGIFSSELAGLPQQQASDCVTWGGDVERQWSWSPDASELKRRWGPEAIKHPVVTVAQCRSADDVAVAIRNGYPCTCASMWGGLMKCPVQDGVLLNSRSGQWPHQMCVLGWMKHDRLGELFWIQNSWKNPHGQCPTGAPPGGFWIRKADMEFMCRDEVYAFSGFQGFPARPEVVRRWRDLIP